MTRTVSIGGAHFDGIGFPVVAGPCSVEPGYVSHAKAVAAAGADILRGCIFKPRSAPDRFAGMGPDGIPLLHEARETTGLPIVAEGLDEDDVRLLAAHVDGFLVGARSMHHSRLLRFIGSTGLPVILKRSFAATYDEWLGAAGYVRATGNENVILCERGIRTFVTESRNTLDISAVPVIREKTDLPIIVDPSHASGQRKWVLPLAMAGAGVGADGLMVECHPNPDESWTDSAQAITPAALGHLIRATRAVKTVNQSFSVPPT